MTKKRLTELEDFFGIDGFSNENLFLKVISPLNKGTNEITIKFHNLKGMYNFEKRLLENLDYLNHEFSSQDVCPPLRDYKRIVDEKKLIYMIRRLK